ESGGCDDGSGGGPPSRGRPDVSHPNIDLCTLTAAPTLTRHPEALAPFRASLEGCTAEARPRARVRHGRAASFEARLRSRLRMTDLEALRLRTRGEVVRCFKISGLALGVRRGVWPTARFWPNLRSSTLPSSLGSSP